VCPFDGLGVTDLGVSGASRVGLGSFDAGAEFSPCRLLVLLLGIIGNTFLEYDMSSVSASMMVTPVSVV